MKTKSKVKFLAQAAVIGILIAARLCSADPSAALNARGEVGRTSYETVPFQSTIWGSSWGASAGLEPANLFWRDGKHFTDPKTMRDAKSAAADLVSQGVVPCAGAQRWQDTYEAAQPASEFPGEPFWVQNDRTSGDLLNQPDFQAWVAWEKQHTDLFMTASDGGPLGYDFRKWDATYGHISPSMPMPKEDWPPGTTAATYADWYAYRWGQTMALSGAYGLMLSDFSDSQPHHPTWLADFNPRIIDSFGKSIGQTIPGDSVPERAAYIDSHLFNQWTDFICTSYAHMFSRLATEITKDSGQPSLVVDQCGSSPSQRRLAGVDERILEGSVPSKNILFIWENQTMSPERGGQSMMYALGGFALAAARDPEYRNGANLCSDTPAYWEAVRKFWPNLSPADQQERGQKELKREWLEACWAHIATREGNVRRALPFASRSYWDQGKIDPQVQTLIQTIVPTRPFGFAVYYSTDTERQLEANAPTTNGGSAYMQPTILMNFKNDGGVVNYYVSDAGLPHLQPDAKPGAWLVLDHPELMSASELAKLNKIAPVLTSLAQARRFSNAPLAFTNGLTGSAFYDQKSRLIVTASNTQATGQDGTITLRGLTDNTYTATDLFTQEKTTFTVSGHKAAMPMHITRWDTRVFAITPASNGQR